MPAGGGRGWSGPCRGDRQQQQVEINETEISGEKSRQKNNRSGYQRKGGTDRRINTIVVLSGEEESEPNQEQVKSLALKVR